MKTMSIDCMQYFVAKDGQVTGERSVSSICQLCVRGNPHPLYACGTPPCIGSPLPMHWVLDLGLRKNPPTVVLLCEIPWYWVTIGSPLLGRLGPWSWSQRGSSPSPWWACVTPPGLVSRLGLAQNPWSWPTLSATCDIRLLWIRIALSTLSWSCH